MNASNQSNTNTDANWERQTIQKVLLEHISEQRRNRRWAIFFKFLFIIFIIGLLLIGWGIFNKDLPQPVMTTQDHSALIDIQGEIDTDHDANADNVRSSLKTAFETKHVKGIILRINSPGGSPVQARHIYNDVQWFRTKHPHIKVYAVIEDMGTSAAYLVASAADAIYADETSLVGSIGVRLDSFGFVDAMHKVGVERRLYTAGKNKGSLDPFSPRNPEEDAFVNRQLALVHEAFIQNVQKGRGDRLKQDPDIFSGQFWCGKEAINLGLVDGFADAYFVAREIIKADEIIDYTATTNLIDRLAHRLGTTVTKALVHVRMR